MGVCATRARSAVAVRLASMGGSAAGARTVAAVVSASMGGSAEAPEGMIWDEETQCFDRV